MSREAVRTCLYIYVSIKFMKISKFFIHKIIVFTAVKDCNILHRRDFVTDSGEG